MPSEIKVAMLCLSQTESDGGNGERIYSADFLAVDEPAAGSEMTVRFGTKRPDLKTGEVYFFTIGRG